LTNLTKKYTFWNAYDNLFTFLNPFVKIPYVFTFFRRKLLSGLPNEPLLPSAARDAPHNVARRLFMLALSLEPNEYITINGDIIVKVSKMARGRCFLAIEADRSIPIVRSAALERSGRPTPECLKDHKDHAPQKKSRRKPSAAIRWTDGREQAARILEKMADRLERKGDGEEAKILRTQLNQLVPDADA